MKDSTSRPIPRVMATWCAPRASRPLNTKRLETELMQPRALFQKNLGFDPNILAYPYGRQDDAVVRRSKERGYVAAFTVRRQGSPSFVDMHRINRSQIYPEMSLDDFIRNLNLFSQEPIK